MLRPRPLPGKACRRCGGPLKRPGRTGFCRSCTFIVYCRLCNRNVAAKQTKGWCDRCKAAVLLADKIREQLGYVRPDAETLAENIQRYRARAEAGLPLFGPRQ